MNLRISWLICGTFLLFSAPAFAAPSVQFAGLVIRTPSAPELPAVFGNHAEGFSIKIDGVAAQAASLRADLFQVAGKLTMPLSKDIHLQEGLTFPDTPSKYLWVSIKFPEVKARTEILVRLALVQNGQANPIQLGDIRFEVFPASTTKELTDLLQPRPDGSAPAVVFGSGQKLRQFLKSQHVTFEDGGAGIPDRFDPGRLYFGELATNEEFQQTQDRSAGARVALFSPDESLPPGLYSERSNAGVLVHVTLPLLDNLAEDPRAQLGFIKVIHLLTASPPSAN